MAAAMKAPSMALLRAFSPAIRSETLPWTARGCLAPQQKAHFSRTERREKKTKKGGVKRDSRITLIRYHLQHPLTPRPLRLGRNRYLRHWTIHRAWMRYQDKLRTDRERELERQYNAMSQACEELRLIDHEGMTAEDRIRFAQSQDEKGAKQTGRLYRIAMLKNGVWKGAPIEYARIQTETPPKDGWNHAWTR